MRNATTYLLSVILIAGTLSAVVSMATIKWVYPKRGAARTTLTQPAPPADAPVATPKDGAGTGSQAPLGHTAPATVTNSPQTTQDPATTRAPVTPHPATPEEQLALDFLRTAAAGDAKGAAAMTTGLSPASLTDQITRHAPVPRRVASLPGAPGSTTVIIWTDNGPRLSRSQYQVTIRQEKVQALKGPMAPEGGYAPLPVTLLDENARPLDMPPHQGRALLLITPRAPEDGLTELLTELQTTYTPLGIDVALVLDIKSPDWLSAARAGGYTGPVWRVKARLEDVPLVARGTLLGAYGVLVDREGFAVASLASLDPLNYGLPDETPSSIATTVFQAYGLMP